MKRSATLLRIIGITVFGLIILWGVSGDYGSAQGLGAGAEAVTAARGQPPKAFDRSPYAAVPAAGGASSDSSVQYAVEGLGLVDLPLVTANGAGSGSNASASATAWTSSVYLFGGRVRVSSLRVSASASSPDGQPSTSGDVAIEGLVVDNVPIFPVEVNQSIPLPGIGTVIAREVVIAPDGAMVFVRGLRVTGETATGPLSGSQLIIAGTSAGIPSVPLAPPAVAAAPLSGVLQSRPPLGTLEPIAGSSSSGDNNSSSDNNDNSSSDNNDNFSSDSNDNVGNGNIIQAARTPTRGTAGPTATGGTAVPTATVTPTVTVTSTPTQTSAPSSLLPRWLLNWARSGTMVVNARRVVYLDANRAVGG
jgi:hypothetical protein